MEHKEFRIPLLIARAQGNVASDIFPDASLFSKCQAFTKKHQRILGCSNVTNLELKSWQEGKNCCVITMSQKKVFLLNSNSRPRSKMEAWSWEYHLGQYSYTYTTKTFDTLGEVVYECTTHGKCTCGATAAPQNPFLLWQIGDHFCDMFSSTNEKRVSWYAVTTIAKNKT